MPPVHGAAVWNDVEELTRLLDEDPGLIEAARPQHYGSGRPLHDACENESTAAARLLLDRGAQVNSRDGGGRTPLMLASGTGGVDLVVMLLERGADPALNDDEGLTALMYASFGGGSSEHAAVVSLLLKDERTLVDDCNRDGGTALILACCCNYAEIARLLLVEGGADHTITDMDDETAMDAARRFKAPCCVKLFEWYEGELERAALLSKARAVVDATDRINKAPEKVQATTDGERQTAREEAAPAYLKARVERREALPSVEVVEVVAQMRTRSGEPEGEKERRAVLEFVMILLTEDLFVELMEGLRYR